MGITTNQWDSYCRGLSDLRSFCERPDIRELLPDEPSISSFHGRITAKVWLFSHDVGTKETLVSLARLLKADKKYRDDTFTLSYEISPSVTFCISCRRDTVCERRVVRTEYMPAETVTREAYNREIVEWDCHPLLAETKE